MKATAMAIMMAAGLMLAAAPATRAQAGQSTPPPAPQAAANPAANVSPAEMDAEIERVRADMRASSVDIITKNMNFTGDQSAQFWPLYHDYSYKLQKINDEKVALVRRFAESGGNLPDEEAKSMTKKWFSLQDQTLGLDRDYYDKFSEKLTPSVATRFFQLQHRMNLLVDLKLASSLPMAMQTPGGGGGK